MIFESTINKVWPHLLEEGGELTCFTLDGVEQHAFYGPHDWQHMLLEAVKLTTRVLVMASEPEVTKCGDPLCGDGCCDDPDCTNVPEKERTSSYLLRADTIEWL